MPLRTKRSKSSVMSFLNRPDLSPVLRFVTVAKELQGRAHVEDESVKLR